MLLQITTARVSAVRRVPPRPTTTRTRVSSHHHHDSTTPENVEEARQWIAAWRAKQPDESPATVAADGAKPKSRGRPKAVKPPSAEGDSPAPAPPAVADPPAAPASAPASIPKPATPKWGTELGDGSIVFSSSELKDRTRSKAALDRVKKGGHAMSPSPNSS